MLHVKNINLKKLGALTLLGFLTSASIGIINSAPTNAAGCEDGSISCITVQFGNPVGDRKVNPTSNVYSATQFYLPVSINIAHGPGYTVDYSVKVYGNGNKLTSIDDSSNTIPSILQNTSYNDLGKNGSEWGMRWNFGDTIEDIHSDYRPVPASDSDDSAIVVANEQMNKNTDNITKQLTLGFAVAVDGNQASGSYSNTITVAVVASPKDAQTLFDITTMQEMTPEICEHTTTPAATAISTSANINVTASGASYTTAIDTTGDYQGNTAYVPQRELTDTRDGKKYTVRKLADGNCWMVSNLEFDFVPTSSKDIAAGTTPSSAFSTTGTNTVTGSQIILTNKDTDLNSMREWTPAIAKELYGDTGTVWLTQRNAGNGGGNEGNASATTTTKWNTDGTDGLRSLSSAAAYPNALYSTKTATTPAFSTANTGSPWQKFGNLYNWPAATLGSSTKVEANGQNASDSICPKGWKLPYSTGDDSFYNLRNVYGITDSGTNQITNFPLNFLRTGEYNYTNGSIAYRTARGFWWSATHSTTSYAIRLRVDSVNVSPQNNSALGGGNAIRCVAHRE